jgi:hypothetical protein
MKKFLIFILILLSYNIYSQTDFLLTNRKTNRNIKISERGELIFVLKTEQDSFNINNRLNSGLLEISNDSITINKYYQKTTHFKNLILWKYSENYIQETIKISIYDIDGVYYSGPFKLGLNTTAKTLLLSSLWLGLVTAPLVSIEYRFNSPFGFNKQLYFNMLKYTFIVGVINIPIYFLSKPKYYKFDSKYPYKKQFYLN